MATLQDLFLQMIGARPVMGPPPPVLPPISPERTLNTGLAPGAGAPMQPPAPRGFIQNFADAVTRGTALPPPAAPRPEAAPAQPLPPPAPPRPDQLAAPSLPTRDVPIAPVDRLENVPMAPEVAAAEAESVQPSVVKAAAAPAVASDTGYEALSDFGNNLLRFGLATMAASRRRGASTLSALGEGGLAMMNAIDARREREADRALRREQLEADREYRRGMLKLRGDEVTLAGQRLGLQQQELNLKRDQVMLDQIRLDRDRWHFVPAGDRLVAVDKNSGAARVVTDEKGKPLNVNKTTQVDAIKVADTVASSLATEQIPDPNNPLGSPIKRMNPARYNEAFQNTMRSLGYDQFQPVTEQLPTKIEGERTVIDRSKLVNGRIYQLPNGMRAVWNGAGFDALNQ